MKNKTIITLTITATLMMANAHSQLEELLALGGMTSGLQGQGMLQENLGKKKKNQLTQIFFLMTNLASREEKILMDSRRERSLKSHLSIMAIASLSARHLHIH